MTEEQAKQHSLSFAEFLRDNLMPSLEEGFWVRIDSDCSLISDSDAYDNWLESTKKLNQDLL